MTPSDTPPLMAKKPKQVPTESLPIYTWSPDQDGQPHIATIGNLPMLFKARTSAEAAKTADNWRTEEMARSARKKQNAAAASARMKARHAANSTETEKG